MIRQCVICGQLHCDDTMTDTQYVRTKRKTTVYFSKTCWRKENDDRRIQQRAAQED